MGQFLQEGALYLLRLTTGRWVDDFFSVEPSATADHALHCFHRMVIALLGDGAIMPEKMCCSNPLNLLGLTIAIYNGEVTVCPNEAKREKWLRQVIEALNTGRLRRRGAEKLAGRLGFTAQNAFRRLGRAMLRPLYQQQYFPLRNGAMHPLLVLGLKWWQHVLKNKLWQKQRLCARPEVIDLFCDAASTPARVAAVCMDASSLEYTAWSPPSELLEMLEPRRDQQIMALELMAIVVGGTT